MSRRKANFKISLSDACREDGRLDELRETWQVDANKARGLDPRRIGRYSDENALFLCSAPDCGRVVEKTIGNWYAGKTRCKACGKHKAAKSSGRPRTKTLREHCRKKGMGKVLEAAWDTAQNSALGLDPDTVGFKSHKPAHFFCTTCRQPLTRRIHNWSDFGRGQHCKPCSRKAAAEAMSLPSIRESADGGDRPAKVMLAQWDFERNDQTPDEVTPTDDRSFRWHCHACGARWRGKAVHRRAAIRGRLNRIERGLALDGPDGSFCCPQHNSLGFSDREIAIACELSVFFNEVESGYALQSDIRLVDRRSFRPDIVLPEVGVVVEYDGYEAHSDGGRRGRALEASGSTKSAYDRVRTLRIESETPYLVVRIRECTPRGKKLPELQGCRCFHVNEKDSVPSVVSRLLRFLQVELGIWPTKPGGPDLAEYEQLSEWLTRDEATRERARLDVGATHLNARLRRMGTAGLLELYKACDYAVSPVAIQLGVSLPQLAGAVTQVFGAPLTQLAANQGLPAHRAALAVGKLRDGSFDPLLGVESDAAIARRAGCSKQAVEERRNRQGIPAAAKNPSKVASRRHELGTRPDAAIAKELGLTKSAVAHYRRARGIPPYRRRAK